MQQHITILGALYLGLSALGVLAAIIVFIGAAGGGLLSGDAQAAGIAAGAGGIIAIIIMLVSLPGLLAGYGLLTRKPWARIVAIVLGAINLLNIPFGTILGIYTLWAMLKPEAQQVLNNGRRF